MKKKPTRPHIPDESSELKSRLEETDESALALKLMIQEKALTLQP